MIVHCKAPVYPIRSKVFRSAKQAAKFILDLAPGRFLYSKEADCQGSKRYIVHYRKDIKGIN